MKRSLIALLTIVALTLAACGTATNGSTTPSDAGATAATDATTTTQPSATEPPVVESTESLATAEVTLPASVFDGEDMKNFDPEAYAKENDFISAIVNRDGSVTITLTQNRHKELLNDVANDCDTAYLELAEATAYITDIIRNEDFSQITIKAIRKDYESAFDLTHISVGYLASLYQIILGNNVHSDISVIDAATGEVIYRCIFPDVLDQS